MYYIGWFRYISKKGEKLSAQFKDLNYSLKEIVERLKIFDNE